MLAIVPPQGGPPPHIHLHEDETFYVLDGQSTFRLADETVVAGPGDFVNVPKGVVHNFCNRTDEPLRMILTFTPAGIERFFEETLERAYDLTQPCPDTSPRWAPATRRPRRATGWSSSSTPDRRDPAWACATTRRSLPPGVPRLPLRPAKLCGGYRAKEVAHEGDGTAADGARGRERGRGADLRIDQRLVPRQRASRDPVRRRTGDHRGLPSDVQRARAGRERRRRQSRDGPPDGLVLLPSAPDPRRPRDHERASELLRAGRGQGAPAAHLRLHRRERAPGAAPDVEHAQPRLVRALLAARLHPAAHLPGHVVAGAPGRTRGVRPRPRARAAREAGRRRRDGGARARGRRRLAGSRLRPRDRECAGVLERRS